MQPSVLYPSTSTITSNMSSKGLIIFALYLIVVFIWGTIYINDSTPKYGYKKATCILQHAEIKYTDYDPLISQISVQAVLTDKSEGIYDLRITSNGTYSTELASNIYGKCCMIKNRPFSCVYNIPSKGGPITMIPYYIYPVWKLVCGIIMLVSSVVSLAFLLFVAFKRTCNNGNNQPTYIDGTATKTVVTQPVDNSPSDDSVDQV